MALLLALAGLSLLLGLSLVFVQNAIFERHRAANNLELARARILTQSVVDQAAALLRLRYDPTDGVHDRDDHYPATVSGASFYAPAEGPFAGRRYLCSTSSDHAGIARAMAVRFGNCDFVPDAVMDVAHEASPVNECRGWVPTFSRGQLMARTAYMIIDDSGALDINALVNAGDSEATDPLRRVGASDAEIALQDLGLAAWDSYTPPAGAKWFSLAHLARALSPADFQSVVAPCLRTYGRSEESYWNDNNDNGVFDPGELYSRLDLTDPDTMLNPLLIYRAFVSPDSELPGDLNDVNDCQWLKRLAADGILATGTARRKAAAEVALRLKDYFDADSIVTLGWVCTDGTLSLTQPAEEEEWECKVVGKEKSFGVSELSFMVVADKIGETDLEIGVCFKGEIFRPRGEDVPLPDGMALLISFTVLVDTYNGTHTFFQRQPFAIPLDRTANEAGGTLWYSSDWFFAGRQRIDNIMANGPRKYYVISNFQLDSLVLFDGVGAVDDFPVAPGHGYWWNWDTNSQNGDNAFYGTLEAYDAQTNEQDEATYHPGHANLWRALPPGYLHLYVNDNHVDIGELTHQSGHDSNYLFNYGDIDVRDGPFERVGEIGRVASYYPGRSLRLWAASAGDEAGMDVDLLDMFTVGQQYLRRGKMNVNADDPRVVDAFMAGTTPLPASVPVTALLERRANGETFTSIGDWYRDADLTGTDPVYDEYEEQMVVKTAELLTARQTYFTVLAVTQAIRDVGPPAPATMTICGVRCQQGRYDDGGDRILAESRILATVRRDSLTGELTVVRRQILQE